MKYWMTWLGCPQLEQIVPTPPQNRLGRFFWLRLTNFWANFWANFWDALFQPLITPAELKVWQTRDDEGHIWWSAHDPATGRWIEHVSEAQIRIWLEQRY